MSKKSTKSSKKTAKSVKSPKAVKVATATNNPYRIGGGYWASVEALRTLGVGKMHDHAKIIPAVKKAMQAEKTWAVFEAKGGKLSADERIIMNVMVTSRKDYGKPLIECGHEVRFDGREKKAGLFKL